MHKQMIYKQIGVEELPGYLQLGHLILLDVRDSKSFAAGHIEGAQHLSLDEFNNFFQSVSPETPILLYCYHGISSQTVAQCLVDKGFKEVYSLTGGFEAWKQWKAQGPEQAP